MSELTRALSFGDLAAGAWGDAWIPAGGQGWAYAGGIADARHGPAELRGDQPHSEWRLTADGLELAIAPLGEPVETGAGGFAQLCRVSGRTATGEIGCMGVRSAHAEPDRPDAVGSSRGVAAWFGDGDGFVLLADRPRRAKGHQQDVIAAALFESGEAIPVPDPRLSSTYWADGRPARAGIELWLTEADEEVEDEHRTFPRRAAGEAVGTAATASIGNGELRLRSELFRWHQRGREGAGVYRLLTPA